MRNQRLAAVATSLAACAAAFFLGQAARSVPAAAPAKTRVFEIRTYTANPGKLEALDARFRDHTTRLFEKHGITNIGYWVPTDEPQSKETLVYILAYENREAAEKSWKAFRADPEWLKAKADSEANGKLVSKVESVFVVPTDYSPLQ